MIKKLFLVSKLYKNVTDASGRVSDKTYKQMCLNVKFTNKFSESSLDASLANREVDRRRQILEN